MIKITIKKTESNIDKIEIKGHAQQAEFGKDLICAAVTGISTGGLNAIDQIKPNNCDIKVDDGLINIIVKENSPELQVILQTIYYQLFTIYEQYQEFVNIKEVEN